MVVAPHLNTQTHGRPARAGYRSNATAQGERGGNTDDALCPCRSLVRECPCEEVYMAHKRIDKEVVVSQPIITLHCLQLRGLC